MESEGSIREDVQSQSLPLFDPSSIGRQSISPHSSPASMSQTMSSNYYSQEFEDVAILLMNFGDRYFDPTDPSFGAILLHAHLSFHSFVHCSANQVEENAWTDPVRSLISAVNDQQSGSKVTAYIPLSRPVPPLLSLPRPSPSPSSSPSPSTPPHLTSQPGFISPPPPQVYSFPTPG